MNKSTESEMARKRALFAMYVVIYNKNHTEAMMLADPRIKNRRYANTQSARLMKDPDVLRMIKEFQEKIAVGEKTIEEKARQILSEIDVVSFADLRRAYAENTPIGKIVHPMGDMARAVESVQIEETIIAEGVTNRTTKIKFHNKMAALKLYGEHYALYKQVIEHGGEIKKPETYRLPDNGMGKDRDSE